MASDRPRVFPKVLTRAPRHRRVVGRPRVVATAGAVPCVALVGGVGAGKTVAAALVAGSTDAVAWCRLAPGYDTAGDLVGLAAASLGTDASGGVTLLDQAGALLGLLEERPTTLVVDDFHLGTDDCSALLAEVVPLLDPASRIVVAGRSRPAGLVGRLDPTAVVVLDAEHLAFDDSESAALFAAHGRTAEDAATWRASLGGWPAGLALAAAAPDAVAAEGAVADLVAGALLGDEPEVRQAVVALTALPYVTAAVADAIRAGSVDVFDRLAERTPLVAAAGGTWRLHDVARSAAAQRLDDAELDDVRLWGARALAAEDPGAAIDVLLDCGRAEDAADVLATALSRIGVDRALTWLYRLPAPLRHRFPPVLAAGRATVDLDLAVAEAERRRAAAPTDEARREAQFSLGSIKLGMGRLADAAGEFEAAAAPGAALELVERSGTWLGVARWWSGDLGGAAAALVHAGDGVWAHWARGSVELATAIAPAPVVAGRGADLSDVVECADRAIAAAARDPGATVAPGESLRARVALLGGDLAGASRHAAAAYAAGTDAGGFDLACGAACHSWCLLASGRLDEAEAVVEGLARRTGARDYSARVEAALIRRELARRRADAEELDRAERRVRTLRQAGFAPVERVAEAMVAAIGVDPEVPALGAAALTVELLGTGAVIVAGRAIPASAWRSKKALEVLRHLAAAGPGGVRREVVIEAVWPERPGDKGRTLLRTALSEMRRVLEPGRAAGEASRFVRTEGDRVAVVAECDVVVARSWAAAGDSDGAFVLLARTLADVDDPGEWWLELGRTVDTLRAEVADRVAGDAGSPHRAAALEALIAAEPWQRSHYDTLAALHRADGDEAAARAVERRWFADDS